MPDAGSARASGAQGFPGAVFRGDRDPPAGSQAVYVGDPLAERRNGIASAHIAPARRRWLRPEAARIVGDPIVLSGREFVKCIATTLTVCGCLRRAQPRPVRADHRRRRQRSGRRCHQPDRRPQIRRPHTGTGRARLPHIGDEHGNSPKASRPTMVNGQRPTAITTNGSTAATSVHPHRRENNSPSASCR